MGRIAAQTAKQAIYQKVKEAEREKVYNDYIDRVGELINGVVSDERGDIVVDLGPTEWHYPTAEMSRASISTKVIASGPSSPTWNAREKVLRLFYPAPIRGW